MLVVGGAAAGAAVVGGGALRLLRKRSVLASLVVVAVTASVVVAAGTAVVGQMMLVSGHAYRVLMLVLALSLVAGLAVAWLLGRSLTAGSHVLAGALREIGEDDFVAAPMPATAELNALSGELVAMQRRLAESRTRERALESSRRDLVAWVSHDLRTPLAGLRAMAEALEDGVVDDDAGRARYHRQIRVESDRLAAMVDDLFELSRIHVGQLALSVTPVMLRDLVSDALAIADPIARSRGVQLTGVAGDDALVAVDVGQMGRALRNLVTNAIRHTPSDGTVEVGYGVKADGVPYLRVSDACGGIPAEDLPRLFEVGYRGEWARTPGDDTGAGLGLAIVQGIVVAHDGRIDVVNEHVGCSFEVRLPVPA
ncbi:HAMP domain-containing sensor histidine kinase [Acidothermaceae bacterium B102]|nr:HAMP domain-containing sensor histidine kinase [Acidothermaceae bacterium B102]